MLSPDDTEITRPDACALVGLWRAYGERFAVFLPEHQPIPERWEPSIAEKDTRGRVNPQYLKHWKFFSRTREFLRDRYRDHRILQGPSLFFDCLVPRFQKKMRRRWCEDEYGQPVAYEVKDNDTWYHRAVRMGIFFGSQVGFSCRSGLCERHWCHLHRQNPHRMVSVDMYALISLFENIPLASSKNVIGKWWGVKLGDLEGRGVRTGTRTRRKVPKQAVYDVLARYGSNVRGQHVEALIAELSNLIRACPLVEWHGRLFDDDHAFLSNQVMDNLVKINSPAVKAYLWLLIRQEELARNTKGPKLKVSDSELASALGISKTTASTYREHLVNLKLAETSKPLSRHSGRLCISKVKY
jgi:hypothetical protein